MDGTVLVADDDRTIRTVLTQALTRAGCKVHATASMTTLMRWVDEGRGDLVITDVVMPDGNGLEALPRIARQRPGLPVIVISAQNTIVTAIRAAELEAFDYLPKPFDLPDLMKRAARGLAARRAPRAGGAGAGGAAGGAATGGAAAGKAVAVGSPSARSAGGAVGEAAAEALPLIGRSRAMQQVYRLVARVLNADLPLLILGESGTGKSLLARAVHDLSDRRDRPFVVAGLAEMDDPDGARRMFARAGHVPGARAGAAEAMAGTLVLDEVSDLELPAQARLVRMLDALPAEGAPRIIATSQHDLAALCDAGRFRRDLYYRLAGAQLAMPPLRERIEDIPLLAEHFLARAEQSGLSLRRLSPEALEEMRRYAWPGNVRQLENAMRRLAVTGTEPLIARAELAALLSAEPERAASGERDGEKLSEAIARHLRRYFDLHAGELPPPGLYARILREMEAPLIAIALEATGGNQARCAELLGINRNTLRKKITDLDMQVTRRRKLM